MAKTEKVMEILIKETRYLVIKDSTARFNPYKIYIKYWGLCRSGYGCDWHRKKVTEFEDLESVLRTLTDACRTRDGWIGFTKDGVLLTH